MKLNKDIIELIEKHGFHLSEITKQDNEYYIELNQHTPEGEDWCETIWFNGGNDDFIESFNKRVNDFDVDEEVEIWINLRGTNGVPNSIKDLVSDAEWKEKILKELSDELVKIDCTKTYEELFKEVSNLYSWQTDIINGKLAFLIPWKETGAFNSIEDATINSLGINEEGKVIWFYSYNDLKELLNQ